ncbi:transcription elongation factor SPT5, partial [Strigomonas culicis]
MSDAEVERHYQERYRALKQEAVTKTQKRSLRYASRFLPTEKDPKVFAIKCRPRMNRILVARIVNKCHAYRIGNNFEHKKMDLGVISVFCLDHVKEYIYVEAYRKLFVENAINGLEGLFRFRITVVDPSDLMKMMEHRPAEEKIHIGSLVRLRQRFYRNDLAQVTSVHSDGTHITVKVVPREDFVGKPFHKATTQLPARFFSPSLAIDVDVSGNGHRWGEYQFDQEGYLLKTVSARMVFSNAQMEAPTAEELARFYNNNRERVREAVARTIAKSGEQTVFQVGDSVRVTTGQLVGTVGTILSIMTGDHTALLSCKAPGRKDPLKLKVELAICAKHFMEGTHIIIDNGEYAGEGGTVLRSMGDVILVLPDRAAMEGEIRVKANDCHQSKLIGTFQHKVGTWQVFDLVSVSVTSLAACIVRLSRTT